MPNNKEIPTPPPGETFIRMYRQGLGDCFLLTFRGDDGKPAHMLIDCGVWDADKATMAQMKKVVENIRDATGGHLNLLVCTHEHWDHNSGFLQHPAVFKNMTIDRVWLAWTENPKDELAGQLKTEYEARRKKLAGAIKRLSKNDPVMGAQVKGILGVDGAMGANGVKANPAEAMNWLRQKALQHPDSFLMPGAVRSIPGAVKSARAYVLGPPYSKLLLGKTLANKKEEKEEVVYVEHDAFGLRFANRFADDAFFAAVDHSGKSPQEVAELIGDELDEYQLGLPFDLAMQTSAHAARRAGTAVARSHYFGDKQKWRRIDNDWLTTAARISLWMSNSTNNTSLVLAIELLPGKKILMMVGDAQIGNWLSWPEVKFKAPDQMVTLTDLFHRTVLYKVGHHGSHNATLRKNGLEKMDNEELIAMIPVNRASVTAKGWAMPFMPMYRALRDKTKGRIIRADEGVMNKPSGISATDWNQFTRAVTTDPVFVQFHCKHG